MQSGTELIKQLWTLGLSDTEIGEYIGVNRVAVNRCGNGKAPGNKYVDKLIELLQIKQKEQIDKNSKLALIEKNSRIHNLNIPLQKTAKPIQNEYCKWCNNTQRYHVRGGGCYSSEVPVDIDQERINQQLKKEHVIGYITSIIEEPTTLGIPIHNKPTERKNAIVEEVEDIKQIINSSEETTEEITEEPIIEDSPVTGIASFLWKFAIYTFLVIIVYGFLMPIKGYEKKNILNAANHQIGHRLYRLPDDI